MTCCSSSHLSPSPASDSTLRASPSSIPASSSQATDDDDIDLDYEESSEPTDDTTQEDITEDGGEEAEDVEFMETDGGESFTAEDFLDMLNAEELGTNGGQASVEQDPRSDEQSEETPTMRITQSQLLRFLNRSGWRRIFQAADGDDDRRAERLAVEADDDDDEYVPSRNRRRRPRRGQDAFPKVPSDIGRELMDSGNFGTNERPLNSIERRKKLAARILRRELGLESPGKDKCANKLAAQELIPSSEADTIIHYDHRCYSGQFSDDGNFFFSCAQDFRVRMYDTSNPYNWKYYKTVTYPFGQWTITDASLSPDNRYLAYSSIRSMVCLAATDPNDHSEPHLLDFADNSPGRSGFFSHSHFGIWSIRFSGDGRELVAGTSDNSVNAYDVETQKPLLSIQGHEDDVNAVCFGDKSSPHLLYSGSDDATLKVWDRRSLQDQRAAGVFLGHTEGLTYIDSKGDGRYVLSNGKDQTMKLWDLRKMISTDKADQIDPTMWSLPFDYRFQSYDTNTYTQHPHDCSLVTFRGHSVLKTLIRCHFSPPGSTDSRYVYSGSEDGSIYIYNLDATVAGKVDVKRATRNTRPPSDDDDDEFMDYHGRDNGAWKTCVRDASWHPNAPIIAATSWNGYGMSHGTCTVHTWNDGMNTDEAEPSMGLRVDAKLNKDRSLYSDETIRERPARAAAGPRARSTRSARMRLIVRGEDDE